jgi:hypothetical protein
MNLPDMETSTALTALAALAALVLSQLPPLLPWIWRRLRGSRVLISTKDSFGLSHWLGRFWILLFLQIENVESVPVAVAMIDCLIRPVPNRGSNSRPLTRLTAATYFTGAPPNAGRLFIGTIRLQPNQHWQEVVTFLPPREDQYSDEAEEIVDQVARQIDDEWERREREGDPNQDPVEVDEALLQRALQLFNQRFELVRGEYELFLAALDRDSQVLGVTKFRFILYERMIRALRETTNDYRFGWGISSSGSERRAWPEPRLILVGSGKDVRREYESITRTLA